MIECIFIIFAGLVTLGVIVVGIWGAIRGEPQRPFDDINKKYFGE